MNSDLSALDLDRLGAFVVFAEHLSFTRAARSLGITQPALHAQVGRLADDLGVQLYRRAGRGLELTHHGLKVLQFAREIRERSQEFLNDIRGTQAHQPVTLVADETCNLYLLRPAMELLARSASVPLRVLVRAGAQALDALRVGEAHIAVTALETLPGNMEAKPLTQVQRLLVVPQDHELTQRSAVGLGDLRGMQFIVSPQGSERARLERELRAKHVMMQVAAEATSCELSLRMVQLGLGAAIVPACCHMLPGLVGIPVTDLGALSYYVVRLRQPVVRAVVEEVEARLLECCHLWQQP